MKSDFLLAITQLAAEKNLSKEVVLGAVEAALVSAYRKEHFTAHQNISVKINSATGKVEVWAEKAVVEKSEDDRIDISLTAARKLKEDAQIGDLVMVESTPSNAGRIAAQTAKQVILQRLHEAEHSAIYEEFADKEKEVINGVVQRIEPRQIYVNLGRAEAILPAGEQIPSERYRVGQRLKVCLIQIDKNTKGPKLIVSRSHPNLLRRLFELEIPEVYNGLVEIKAVAREAGYRSKVAVAARQDGIDPVGCCVGLRGIRIQNIVNELNGERIDVVAWSSEVPAFIASALSPAQVSEVRLKDTIAQVIVPDRQLSLAIGKDGQNARLAAKLTGWRIDIKSASVLAAERALEKEAKPAEGAEIEKEGAVPAQAVAEPKKARAKKEKVVEEVVPAEVEGLKEAPVAKEAEEVEPEIEELEAELEAPEGVAEEETAEVGELSEELEEITLVPVSMESKSKIRFAEDIFDDRMHRFGSKGKKKKKGMKGKGGTEDGTRLRKARQPQDAGASTDEY